MPRLSVNGEEREFTAGQTLSDLIADLHLEASQVAIELNREVVPRAQHAKTPLSPEDRIEIVTFVGGG